MVRVRLVLTCLGATAAPLALAFPSTASAAVQCFFPGGACNFATLYVNQTAESSYSKVWTQAHVIKNSPGHLSRITFIDGSGSWHGSNADTNQTTASGIEPPTYDKKAYCKNIDASAYAAKCSVGG